MTGEYSGGSLSSSLTEAVGLFNTVIHKGQTGVSTLCWVVPALGVGQRGRAKALEPGGPMILSSELA